MGRLIHNFVLFVVIGMILLGPICFISRRYYRQTLNAPVFHFSKDTTILVVGDSHTEASINPKWLPHSQNIAHSAENYFYTYYKLRHFLDNNRQIKTVIIGFSWHNFSRQYQESFLFGDDNNTVSLYFPLLDEPGKSSVRSWKSAYLLPFGQYSLGLPLKVYDSRLLLRSCLGATLNREDFGFFGGYLKLTVSNIDQALIKAKLNKYYAGTTADHPDTSPYMHQYLENILAMCSSRNVQVVLLNTPVHELYREGVPVSAVSDFEARLAQLKSKYSNVTYLDYSNFKLDTQNYYDGDHTNERGAEIMTKDLAKSGLIHNEAVVTK